MYAKINKFTFMMKILILFLLIAPFSFEQKTDKICVEKCLQVKEEAFRLKNYEQLFSDCPGVEVISEGFNFRFIGFEKYGYELKMNTREKISELADRNQVIGYFDMVNSSDSNIQICSLGYAVDKMYIGLDEKKEVLKPGESIRVKYILVRGYTTFNKPYCGNYALYDSTMSDSISNYISFFERLRIEEQLAASNENYLQSNLITICTLNTSGEPVYTRSKILFRIPVKYINKLTFM